MNGSAHPSGPGPDTSSPGTRVLLDPRPERLFQALVGSGLLDRDRDALLGSAFRPKRIVVGDRATREWLEMALARRFGIAASFVMPTLDGLFDQLGQHWFGPRPRSLQAALRPGLLRLRIDGLLDRVESSGAASVGGDTLSRFLARVSEPGQRLKLADTLARQFLEYRRERPDWLAGWETRPDSEDLQSQIWFRLHQEILARSAELDGAPQASALGTDRLVLLEEAILGDPTGEASGWESDFDPRAPLIVFGVDRISPIEGRILSALARKTPVWLGLYSPVEAFLDPSERGVVQDLCRRLGRPAVELRRTLTEDLQLDFEAFESTHEFPDAADRTLLSIFQAQVRTGSSSDGVAGTDKEPFRDPFTDHSLEVHEAHGPAGRPKWSARGSSTRSTPTARSARTTS